MMVLQGICDRENHNISEFQCNHDNPTGNVLAQTQNSVLTFEFAVRIVTLTFLLLLCLRPDVLADAWMTVKMKMQLAQQAFPKTKQEVLFPSLDLNFAGFFSLMTSCFL